jgi:isoleucyl-tRNA synthetase/very-short-patch-repair endonuclease
MNTSNPYPEVNSSPNFPALEENILRFWQENSVFEKSVENRPAKDGAKTNEYIFFDGPPFANGLPHYGHLLTGFVKDLYARYHTMKGERVERRFGWDCHGLPAEMATEKELGIAGTVAIRGYGIENFNSACRSSVMRFTEEWEYYVTRQGRWVDFQDDYKTMDTSYMESVIWAFKQLYDKGLIYEAYRVVPYSWAAETVVSNFETRMDNAYRERADKAITVGFDLKSPPPNPLPQAGGGKEISPPFTGGIKGGRVEYRLLAWTTTPWTLPSNLALAVGPDMYYGWAYKENVCNIMAYSSMKSYAKELFPSTVTIGGVERQVIVETPRFAFTPFLEQDFDHLWLLHSDPEVTAKTADGTQTREQAREEFHFYAEHQKKYGYSQWAIFDKTSGAFVGRGGLSKMNRTEDELELRLAFVKDYWGKGVASEVAPCLFNWAFAALGAEHVMATTFPDHAVSRAMMEKVGMRHTKDMQHYSCGTTPYYIITREEFLAKYALKGSQLVGMEYEPLFPYFAGHANAFKVLAGDFITEGDGTGVVHMAPGFGEDDQRVCEENGIALVVPVDGQGRFTAEVSPPPSPLPQAGGGKEVPPTVYGGRLGGGLFRSHEFTTRDLQALKNARELRHNSTDAENKLWSALRGKKIDGHKFRRQHPIGNFITDFCCIEKKLVVELDGSQHNDEEFLKYDAARSAFLNDAGYTVIRFWNNQVFEHIESVVETVLSVLEGKDIKAGWDLRIDYSFRDSPPLTPPPSGRGITGGHNELPTLTGRNVFDTIDDIIIYLKKTGAWLKTEQYLHNYPHCWRTDQPLIYKAVPSWYVEVTKFRDRMVELNQQINWIPGHIKDGLFGKWLENARDWSISRNRFWGAPIPVWKSPSGKIKVFGSIAELEAASGKPIKDLHRPFIDDVVITENGEEFRRVEDVLDCWFESGSMPYAQVHYPFENKEWFETHLPADFIVEYQSQTRGWFYTLMVLSTALFDRPPFKNCICHGVVLDTEGQKLSKRLNNYADPKDVFATYGADAMRWLMMSSKIMHGEELQIDKDGNLIKDVIRLVIKPLWSAYNFFCMYANADKIVASCSPHAGERELEGLSPHQFREGSTSSAPLTESANASSTLPQGESNYLDTYILSKLSALGGQVTQALDGYDSPTACSAVVDFMDVLNNWYIRRNRQRFWKGERDADKQAAYDTLYTVLVTVCQLCAPLLPMITEEIYSGLMQGPPPNPLPQAGGGKEISPPFTGGIKGGQITSIHLTDWPDVSNLPQDETLINKMDKVRDACNAALSIRNASNIRIRQPLSKLYLAGAGVENLGQYYRDLIADELNVKEVIFDPDFSKYATLKLQVNLPVVGKRLGAKVKEVMAAINKGEWQRLDDSRIEICGENFTPDEYSLLLAPKDKANSQPLSSQDAIVMLDTAITPELEQEGIARDLVRMIQQARKDAGLNVADRINLALDAPQNILAAYRNFRDYIAEQTLAVNLDEGKSTNLKHTFANDMDGESVTVALGKVG